MVKIINSRKMITLKFRVMNLFPRKGRGRVLRVVLVKHFGRVYWIGGRYPGVHLTPDMFVLGVNKTA